MKERLIREPYKKIGEGVESRVYFSSEHPEWVIKFPKSLFSDRHILDKKGKQTKQRIKENLDVLKKNIDPQFMVETRVKGLGDICFIQQRFTSVKDYATSEKAKDDPQLGKKFSSAVDQSLTMYANTGKMIDWFGLNKTGVKEIFKTFFKPGYWGLPNLAVDGQETKIFDSGLYDKYGRNPSAFGWIDSLVCRFQVCLLKKVQRKIEITDKKAVQEKNQSLRVKSLDF